MKGARENIDDANDDVRNENNEDERNDNINVNNDGGNGAFGNVNNESVRLQQSRVLFWTRYDANTPPALSLRKINDRTDAQAYEHNRTTPPNNCFKEHVFQLGCQNFYRQ